MSNYHFDEESLLELAKGIDDKGFKTTIKCNIGEDGFVESGSLDQLTKPGIYKLQICLLSDEAKQDIQNGRVDITGDVFGYCYVNVLTESKITIYGQQTVIINEDLSKLKAYLINAGISEEDFSLTIKALPKLQYTRIINHAGGTNYTFSDWEEKTEKEVEISINLEAFSDFISGDDAAIEEAKKNIFIVPTDLDPGVYIAKVDITSFMHSMIPEYYTASMDSSGLSYNETPSGGGYYQLTVEDATFNGVPINEWRGTEDDGDFVNATFTAKLYITEYNPDGSILEPKTLLTSIEETRQFYTTSYTTIPTNYGDIIVSLTSDGTKPSLEQYIQTYGKQYLRWQLTVDENKIPESIIYNQTLDFTTSFNPYTRYFYCSLQDILLENLSGSGKIQRTIVNDVNSGWQSINRIGVNVLNLIQAEAPINAEYSWNNGLEISHATKSISINPLSSSSNGNFQAITAVGVDSWGHVDNITTTNYSVNPATSTHAGLMSSNDKIYIESIKPVLEVDGSDKLLINNGVKVDGNTVLKGYFNQGLNTVTTGIYAHAEGNGSIASGSYSHAEGYSSIASNVSHSEGSYTVSSGRSSHSEGDYTELQVTVKESSTKFQINDPGFIIRAGMYVRYGDDYSKITEVTANSSILTISLQNELPIVVGQNVILITVADNIGSHAEGTSSSSVGSSAHAEGAYNCAAGNRSHAEGYNTFAYANQSHAEGYKSLASGFNSHAEGNSTVASGQQAHAEGNNTTASGSHSHAEGNSTVASGYAAHAEGYLCKATGDYSRATGVSTTASHLFSNVNGRSTKSSNAYQTVIGRANVDKGDALFIIGNGTVNDDNTVITASNAFVVTSPGNGIFSGSCTASAFPTSSDSRLKDVISDLDISKAYNLIENCSTILYTLKSEADQENKRIQLGLLAQEVKEFFPEIVYEDSDGFLSLDYSRLTVIIMSVLKDLIVRVSNLEKK